MYYIPIYSHDIPEDHPLFCVSSTPFMLDAQRLALAEFRERRTLRWKIPSPTPRFEVGQISGLGEFSRNRWMNGWLQARIMNDVPVVVPMFPKSWGAANLELCSGISLFVGRIWHSQLAKPSFLRRRPTKEHFFASISSQPHGGFHL